MDMDLHSLIPLLPELVLLLAGCAILVLDLFLTDRQRDLTYVFSLARPRGGRRRGHRGRGQQPRDPDVRDLRARSAGRRRSRSRSSWWPRWRSSCTRGYLQARRLHRGEFYVLGLFAVLGMSVLVSAASFLTAYLGLELLALSLYALVAFDRDSGARSEAAMKYFVLGALASGHAALRHLHDLRRHRRAGLRHGQRDRWAPPTPTAPCWCSGSCSSSSASRSSSAQCRSTCGCRTSTRARRRR